MLTWHTLWRAKKKQKWEKEEDIPMTIKDENWSWGWYITRGSDRKLMSVVRVPWSSFKAHNVQASFSFLVSLVSWFLRSCRVKLPDVRDLCCWQALAVPATLSRPFFSFFLSVFVVCSFLSFPSQFLPFLAGAFPHTFCAAFITILVSLSFLSCVSKSIFWKNFKNLFWNLMCILQLCLECKDLGVVFCFKISLFLFRFSPLYLTSVSGHCNKIC